MPSFCFRRHAPTPLRSPCSPCCWRFSFWRYPFSQARPPAQQRQQQQQQAAPGPAPAPAPVPAPPPPQRPPPPAAAPANQAEAEVALLFSLLQEKGRLVDFLMEDITGYDESQVAAAARVVHQGCRQVLQEHLKISPIAEAGEGSQVTVPAGYAADEYRIVGKLSGQPPFTGTLVHKGWKTEWVKLPRLVRTDEKRLPAIAPAEVELA